MTPEENQASPIGILSAFRPEVSALAGRLSSPKKTHIGGRRAWHGRLGGAGLVVLAGGMGPEKSAASARALIQRGVSSLLCVGAAGALDDNLEVGDLVVAEWVFSAGGSQAPTPCDRDWVERAKGLAAEKEFRMSAGGLVSVEEPLLTPEDKARLRSVTVRPVGVRPDAGALAVDMESAAAADQASGVPFLAIRVITDDSRTALPDLRSVWRKPGRLLADGAGFLARVGPMRRSLLRLQEFLGLLLRESTPAGRGGAQPG